MKKKYCYFFFFFYLLGLSILGCVKDNSTLAIKEEDTNEEHISNTIVGRWEWLYR